MKCPKCEHDNLAGSQFCEKCGTSLKVKPAPPPGRVIHAMPAPPPTAALGTSAQPRLAPAPAPGYAPAPAPAPVPLPSYPPPGYSAAAPAPISAPAPAAPADPQRLQREQAFAALEHSKGQIIYISAEDTTLGRFSVTKDETMQSLEDFPGSETVSRRHARIFKEGDAVFIEDLKSANGTFVNGERLIEGVQRSLFENDEIALGAVRFTFHQKRNG
ncbi:MAG: FHA domain-containing protein [bacterium]|nr:FHA domain-containing protein [bacterium]